MSEASPAEELRVLLNRREADGSPRYSQDQVEDFLAVLVFAKLRNSPNEKPNPKTSKLLRRFFERIGAEDPASVGEKIEPYFREHPLHPELTFALQSLIRRNVAARGGAVGRDSGMAKFLGMESSRLPSPTEEGERPIALRARSKKTRATESAERTKRGGIS